MANDTKTTNDVWMLLGQMDSKLDRVVEDSTSHAKRLTDLEMKSAKRAGFFAAIGAVVGSAASAVGALILAVVKHG